MSSRFNHFLTRVAVLLFANLALLILSGTAVNKAFNVLGAVPTPGPVTSASVSEAHGPELRIEKKVNGGKLAEAKPGDTVTFTIRVSNIGLSQATNIDVEDVLPKGLVFVGNSSVSTGVTVAFSSPSSTNPKWRIAALDAGKSFLITFDAKIEHGLSGENCDCDLENTALIELPDQHDNDGCDGSDGGSCDLSDTAIVRVKCPEAELKVEKTSKVLNTPLRGKSGIEYTIVVENKGEADAKDVDIVDNIPSLTHAISHFKIVTTKGSAGSWSWKDGRIGVHFAKIREGETCTITFQVLVKNTAACGDEIVNRVVVKRKGQEEDEAEDRLTIECDPAELVVRKEAKVLDKPLKAGSWILYTVTVKNEGEAAAENVQVTDDIDGLTSLKPDSIEINCDKGSEGHDNGSTASRLEVVIPELKGGESCVITFKVQVKEEAGCGDEIVNRARAEAGPVDPWSNETKLTIECDPAELVVRKTSKVLDDHLRGKSRIRYTIEVDNTGEDDAEDVDIVDNISTLTHTISDFHVSSTKGSAGSWSWKDGQIEVHFAKIRGGEACTITFQVLVADKAACGDEIVNRVVVKQKEQEEDTAENRLTIDCDPAKLEARKNAKVLDKPLLADSWIEYSIEVENVGEQSALNVEVFDAIDELTSLDLDSIEIICNHGCEGSSEGSTASKLHVQIPELQGGETCTITFKVQVNREAGCEDRIVNKALVKSGALSVWTNAVSLTVFCPPELCSSTKTVEDRNGGRVEPGDKLTYTITLTNTSITDATGVRVTDDIPKFTEAFQMMAVPAGAVDHSSPAPSGVHGTGLLDVGNITVPAHGSVQISFDVLVTEDAKRGSVISNTAHILPANEGGEGCFISSRNLVVAPPVEPYQIIDSIDLGMDPVMAAINSETHEAVITGGLLDRVVILNLLTREVEAIIPMDSPHGVAINPNTSEAIITNLWSDRATILDLETQTTSAVLQVGSAPRGVAINPKTNVAVIANSGGAGSVSVVDLDSGIVISTIPVGFGPDSVAINSETNQAAVTNNQADSVSLIDLDDLTLEGSISTGHFPLGVAYNTDTNLLYVVNQANATLSVIDPDLFEPMGQLSVGSPISMPDQVVIDPQTNRAVISNFNDDAVVFLNLENGQVLAEVDMRIANGLGPRGLAVDFQLGIVLVVHQQSNVVVLVSL